MLVLFLSVSFWRKVLTLNTMSKSEIVLDESIDQILTNFPIGSVDRAIANNLYGVNFRQTGNPVPRSKDLYGFTFFTRPQLNLTLGNISNFRAFYSLLTSNEKSYQRYTRLMLDPRLNFINSMKCPFVNNRDPFIPILTNNIVSLSGWPDLSVPSYTSEPGLYGEEHSFVDGVTNHYESFDLDISFKNTRVIHLSICSIYGLNTKAWYLKVYLILI